MDHNESYAGTTPYDAAKIISYDCTEGEGTFKLPAARLGTFVGVCVPLAVNGFIGGASMLLVLFPFLLSVLSLSRRNMVPPPINLCAFFIIFEQMNHHSRSYNRGKYIYNWHS